MTSDFYATTMTAQRHRDLLSEAAMARLAQQAPRRPRRIITVLAALRDGCLQR